MAIVVGGEAAEGGLHLGEQAHARVAARAEARSADTVNALLAWSGRSQHAAEDLVLKLCNYFTYSAASALLHALQKSVAAFSSQVRISVEGVDLKACIQGCY